VKLDHPRLLVANFAECFRFYRDLLGFRVTWGDEGNVYAAFSDREGTDATLALYRRQKMAEVVGTGDLPPAAPSPSQDRVALVVATDDLDAAVERLQAQGVHFLVGPRDFPDWGIRAAYLRDPDGNLIELYGHLPRERWTESLKQQARQYRGQ
jgi:lactoylglutathione lyase